MTEKSSLIETLREIFGDDAVVEMTQNIELTQEEFNLAAARLAMIHTATRTAIDAAASVDKPGNLLCYAMDHYQHDNPIHQGVACHLLDIIQEQLNAAAERNSDIFWTGFKTHADKVIEFSAEEFHKHHDPSRKQSTQDGSSESPETSG